MKAIEFLSILQVFLLFSIAVLAAVIAYWLRLTLNARRTNELYKRRLGIYRDLIKLLSVISQDGDISRDELIAFRARTHESIFLFEQAVADYVHEMYDRGLKLLSSNSLLKGTELPVGEERDRITVENSKQLIWFGDQLPQLQQKFGPYFSKKN